MAINRKEVRDIAAGIGFLLPNILGFVAFTLIPLLMSIYMAFTDWNLEMHNFFRFEPIRFVGFDNFVKLFSDPDFPHYLGNTFFLMIGIPFGVAGSLVAALLLNMEFQKGDFRKRLKITMILTAVMVSCFGLLAILGFGGSGMALLLMSLTGAVLILGSIGQQTVYRTLFYFPYFTAGVATYILWKKLYNPLNGPINNALSPLLNLATPVARQISPACNAIGIGLLVAAGLIFLWMVWRKLRLWRDGESGTASVWLGMILSSLPLIFAWWWTAPTWTEVAGKGGSGSFILLLMAAFLIIGWGAFFVRCSIVGRKYSCIVDRGLGDSTIIDGSVMVLNMALIGLCCVVWKLPEMAAAEEGLTPPMWLSDYYWAKPSLLIMGFWGAIGSNNMLLYLAGLSGISPELYEAADIDGASPWQRFWNITWPQLSNVTFFIMIMSIIGGLQGGFDMARVMTDGGPAGSTTTLAYYIYNEGFSTGRLGYASAVSWMLFFMVFIVTIFNWKFGNRYTND